MLRTPFQLVLGTHAETPVPAAARAHGLAHRFALVQSTHHPDSADMVVDAVPLLALLVGLEGSDTGPGVFYWDEKRRRRATLTAVAGHYRIAAPGDREVLSSGEWRRAGQLAILLSVEPWAHVGGPAIYHDSYTYSFYAAEDLSERLLAALRFARLEPTAVIRVSATPEKTGFLRNLVRRLTPS